MAIRGRLGGSPVDTSAALYFNMQILREVFQPKLELARQVLSKLKPVLNEEIGCE